MVVLLLSHAHNAPQCGLEPNANRVSPRTCTLNDLRIFSVLDAGISFRNRVGLLLSTQLLSHPTTTPVSVQQRLETALEKPPNLPVQPPKWLADVTTFWPF